MKTWTFDWNGHHFEVEVDEQYGFVGSWRWNQLILRVDEREVDRQSSMRGVVGVYLVRSSNPQDRGPREAWTDLLNPC